MTNLRVLHLWLGLAAFGAFLYTGIYMRMHFPEAHGGNETVRYLFRANHVYILFAALLNLTLGFHLSDAGSRRKRTLQTIASLLVVAAAPLLVWAFFTEAPRTPPVRPITLLGVVSAAGGTALHGVAALLGRAR